MRRSRLPGCPARRLVCNLLLTATVACCEWAAAKAEVTPLPPTNLPTEPSAEAPQIDPAVRQTDWEAPPATDGEVVQAQATRRWFQDPPAYSSYAMSAIEAGALTSSDANAALRMAPTPIVGAPENAGMSYQAERAYRPAVSAGGNGRAALIGDSTRMAAFAKGRFLPSAIPVAGQPYFGSGDRMLLQGSGSAVNLDVSPGSFYGDDQSDLYGFANVLVDDATFPSDGSRGSSFVVQQAFGQVGNFVIGLSETAFADEGAVPETMDVAGPAGRVTVQPAGLGETQGRMSCFLLTRRGPGLYGNISLEQPNPQIPVTPTTGTYSRYPDFIGTLKYSDGIEGYVNNKYVYVEKWHVQFGTLFRSLGLESADGSFDQDVFGWGLSLSGVWRFAPREQLIPPDGLFFSVTHGEGIAHYITDLNAAPDAADAVVGTSGLLTPLPVLAWYVGYTHNWTDRLRSTATYSQVNLDSIVPQAAGASPYRVGDYVAANLVWHVTQPNKTKPTMYTVLTGIEYLYGHKEVLDGADGDAHRVMWVVVVRGWQS